MNEVYTHRLTNDLIKKIVQEDLKYFASFNKISNDTILRLISYLAVKKPELHLNLHWLKALI